MYNLNGGNNTLLEAIEEINQVQAGETPTW